MLNVSGGKGYFSKRLCSKEVLAFNKPHDLFLTGVHGDMPGVEEWSAKHGQAMARLVPCFQPIT